MSNKTLYQELVYRGLFHQTTTKELDNKSAYCGFDPTALSLQVGNLAAIMTLSHFLRRGNNAIALVGGATGCIGDPSGKVSERQLLSKHDISSNVINQQQQLYTLFDRCEGLMPADILNNDAWFSDITFIEFLRDTGKYFSVNEMLSRESVKSRIESGISYTEFSYMLMQAHDFLYLSDKYNCDLQIGGSDQWGNMCAGISLIRKARQKEAHALTIPLITDSNGKKFGKSEGGAIWLDPNLTSPYKFYQFWLNTPDNKLIDYIKIFTYTEEDTITYMSEYFGWKELREYLAFEVTKFVHDLTEANNAINSSKALFTGDVSNLTGKQLQEIFAHVSTYTVKRKSEYTIFDLLYETKIKDSKGEIKRLVIQGGVTINSMRVQSIDDIMTIDHAVDGKFFLIKIGKKSFNLIEVGE